MNFISSYLILGAMILGIMSMLWLLSLSLINSSIVDIFWGTGFVLITWVSFFLTPEGVLARKLLISSLVTLWGLRLSFYIFYRNWGTGGFSLSKMAQGKRQGLVVA